MERHDAFPWSWDIFRIRAQSRWPLLTDYDLRRVYDSGLLLTEILQESYGLSPIEAVRDFHEFVLTYKGDDPAR